MAISQVQVPQKPQGGGFLDVLGKLIQVGAGIAAVVGTGGAAAPAVAAEAAAGAAAPAVAAAAAPSALGAMGRALGTAGSIAGGAQAAGSLMGGDAAPYAPGITPSQQKSSSSSQELTQTSKYIKDALDVASTNPDYEHLVEPLSRAYPLSLKNDLLEMRRRSPNGY